MTALIYDLISTLPISFVTVLLTRAYYAEDISDLLLYITQTSGTFCMDV